MAQDQLAFIFADLIRFTEEETIGLLLDVQANLQQDTPRDTGWARAGWVPSVGIADDGAGAEKVKNPQPSDITRAQTRQQEGLASVLNFTLEQGVILTTNHVPYIIPLNEGHSKQAGAAFVQRAVADALNYHEVTRGRARR